MDDQSRKALQLFKISAIDRYGIDHSVMMWADDAAELPALFEAYDGSAPANMDTWSVERLADADSQKGAPVEWLSVSYDEIF